MSATVTEVDFHADEFALHQTLTTLDGLDVEIERVVAHDADRIMPYVWVRGNDLTRDELEAVLADDPSVTDLELLAELDDEWLYRMDWISDIETLVQILVTEEGTILAAAGTNRMWTLRILFPEHEALSRTHDYCRENGFSFEIQTIYQLDEGRQGRFGLTDDQQETLTLAYERGYYNIPRQASASDLATELDISHQAVSERMRRGHYALVGNALIIGRGASTDDRQ